MGIIMVAIFIEAYITIVATLTMVGFGLNPHARIVGIPVWMNSERSFFVLALCAGAALSITMAMLVLCLLRLADRRTINPSPLKKG